MAREAKEGVTQSHGRVKERDQFAESEAANQTRQECRQTRSWCSADVSWIVAQARSAISSSFSHAKLERLSSIFPPSAGGRLVVAVECYVAPPLWCCELVDICHLGGTDD